MKVVVWYSKRKDFVRVNYYVLTQILPPWHTTYHFFFSFACTDTSFIPVFYSSFGGLLSSSNIVYYPNIPMNSWYLSMFAMNYFYLLSIMISSCTFARWFIKLCCQFSQLCIKNDYCMSLYRQFPFFLEWHIKFSKG